jgi:hypothetical protein
MNGALMGWMPPPLIGGVKSAKMIINRLIERGVHSIKAMLMCIPDLRLPFLKNEHILI